jgi:hypothetical protein
LGFARLANVQAAPADDPGSASHFLAGETEILALAPGGLSLNLARNASFWEIAIMSGSTSAALALTDEIKGLINNALADGAPLLLAAVSPDHRPVLSFRGSVQTFSDDQLRLWARNANGGTLDAIRANPNVALMYRSATTPLLQFIGRARIVTDEAERTQVFESAPKREQAGDPERKGVAVIVDLDRVEGVLKFGPEGPQFVRLAR